MTTKKALDYYNENKPNKVVLRQSGTVLETLALTALVRDIHKCYRGLFVIDVRTDHLEIWENNPLIEKVDGRSAKTIDFGFNLDQFTNSYQTHFMGMFHDQFNAAMGLDVILTDQKADLYISDYESSLARDDEYWLLDFTFDAVQPTKNWNIEKYDQLKEALSEVKTVEIREYENLREVIRLYHACKGVICHSTAAVHFAGSIPNKSRNSNIRPCIVIGGDVDDVASHHYPGHEYINSIGCLECSKTGGCHRNIRCLDEVHLKNQKVSRCMNNISADSVINAVSKFLKIETKPKVEKSIEVSTDVHEYEFPTLNVERDYKGLFYSKFDNAIDINGSYEGMSAFLILGGPSFTGILEQKLTIHGKEYTGKEVLNMPGFVTMAVNNAPKTFRPDLWTCVDPPSHFIKSIWFDPKIQKIVPTDKKSKKVFDSDKWEYSGVEVYDCPNVQYFKLNNQFDHNTFLELDTFNWGQNGDSKCSLGVEGKRSVMLTALRILYELGIKNVYLLGCDFKMSATNTYHFEQKRHEDSVNSNNNSYSALNVRFDALNPIFEKSDFNVYNCYEESGLKSFPYISFEDAIKDAIQLMPNLETERTADLYDRTKEEREQKRKQQIIENFKETIEEYAESEDCHEHDMTDGILYYNVGTKCLARLLTSIHSLRKVYSGNICILSSGEESHYACKSISQKYDCIFKEVEKSIDFKHYYWYEKSRMHEYTPFENTIFIDSDTIIQKDPSDMFEMIQEHDFVVPQFGQWTTQTRVINKRISRWLDIDKDLVDFTLQNKFPSVNVGVYGFNKKSALMKNWYDFTIQNKTATLPEETTCHLLLNLYKGKVVDSLYNYSCKHDLKDVKEAVVIHYHGNKHCRLSEDGELLYNAELWVENWMEVFNTNTCNVMKWYGNIGDGKLKRFMKDKKA